MVWSACSCVALWFVSDEITRESRSTFKGRYAKECQSVRGWPKKWGRESCCNCFLITLIIISQPRFRRKKKSHYFDTDGVNSSVLASISLYHLDHDTEPKMQFFLFQVGDQYSFWAQVGNQESAMLAHPQPFLGLHPPCLRGIANANNGLGCYQSSWSFLRPIPMEHLTRNINTKVNCQATHDHEDSEDCPVFP